MKISETVVESIEKRQKRGKSKMTWIEGRKRSINEQRLNNED